MPYRSFLNLAAGKIVCIMKASDESTLAAWFRQMQMPCDSITPVELGAAASEKLDGKRNVATRSDLGRQPTTTLLRTLFPDRRQRMTPIWGDIRK